MSIGPSIAHAPSETNPVRGILVLVALACLAACGGDDTTGPGATCSVGQVLSPGEECSVGGGETFEVGSDGLACLVESDGISRRCSTSEVTKGGFSASNIDDTLNWRIDSMPS